MKATIIITKQALWRTPLAILIIGYATLCILTMLGVNIPTVNLGKNVFHLDLGVSRWWDPVFLALAGRYIMTCILLHNPLEENFLPERERYPAYRKEYLDQLGTGIFIGVLLGGLLIPAAYLQLPPIAQENTFLWTMAIVAGYDALIVYLFLGLYGMIEGIVDWRKHPFDAQRGIRDRKERLTATAFFLGMAIGCGIINGFAPFIGAFLLIVTIPAIASDLQKLSGHIQRIGDLLGNPLRRTMQWIAGQ